MAQADGRRVARSSQPASRPVLVEARDGTPARLGIGPSSFEPALAWICHVPWSSSRRYDRGDRDDETRAHVAFSELASQETGTVHQDFELDSSLISAQRLHHGLAARPWVARKPRPCGRSGEAPRRLLGSKRRRRRRRLGELAWVPVLLLALPIKGVGFVVVWPIGDVLR